jgi:GNAT superfamily N-acetyltransferase
MELTWARDLHPVWDEHKQRVVGGAPPGSLAVHHPPGAELPGDWWAARAPDGTVLGYGWLDSTWGGDAEVLLAVDPAAQNQGVGSFVLEHVEREAARQGVNYVYNTVRAEHPHRDEVHDWLAVRGYRGNNDDTVLRKRVRDDGDEASAPVTAGAAAPAPDLSARPPGHEESGGYVDVEDHRY